MAEAGLKLCMQINTNTQWNIQTCLLIDQYQNAQPLLKKHSIFWISILHARQQCGLAGAI